MKIYSPEQNDPAYCLAAEEYLLTHHKIGDAMMLWVSSPSVIIGKFQNPYAEVSLTECEKAGVKIFRRNSGGGTVYHDKGNLNYTVFSDKSESSPDYERFLTPVISFLDSIGIKAEIMDTSAVFIGNKKISGNAQSVVGTRVMHHGTLLFDADLTCLGKLTGHAREKIKTKAIQSNPSPVTNIRQHLVNDMTLDQFKNNFFDYFKGERASFSKEEIKIINSLADEKYRTWDWIFARSHSFELSSDGFTLTSEKGKIISSSEYCDILAGMPLIPDRIKNALTEKIGEVGAEKITKIIFD